MYWKEQDVLLFRSRTPHDRKMALKVVTLNLYQHIFWAHHAFLGSKASAPPNQRAPLRLCAQESWQVCSEPPIGFLNSMTSLSIRLDCYQQSSSYHFNTFFHNVFTQNCVDLEAWNNNMNSMKLIILLHFIS